MNRGEYAIVSDFDGTITVEDTNDLLVQVYGNAENARIDADYIAGRLPTRAAMARHFEVMRVSMEAYHALLDAHAGIDPSYDAFYQRARAEQIPFFIVSAGYRQAIERVLGEHRLRDVPVFANDLRGTEHLTPVFAFEADCAKPIGPCGICKRACLAEIRRKVGRKILYIGDGLTDRCAAEEADLLFAKHSLAAFCEAEGLAFIPFETFADIEAYLWRDEGRA